MRLTGIAAAILLTAGCATAEPPSEWPVSPHGADDRIGAINHITPAKTAAAAALVTEGKTFQLGMVTGPATPAYGPREYDVTILQLSDGTGIPLGENKATGNDDLVRTFVGVGSQIDGLGHMGIDHYYYNRTHASDFVTTAGLTQFGTHTIPPIATRGVLLDMTAQFGASPVPAGTAFNRAEIDAAAAAAGVAIETGDVVLFHTGTLDAELASGELTQAFAGLGVEGAEYLASLGVVAVGADSWGLEVIPFETPTRPFEVHQTLLAKHGVYILENMATAELAEDGAGEFFFVLGIPRLEGTVQAIINPVAMR
ncbi:MAG: cyclase family protein [Pseudomonadota bacterium]